MSEEATTWSSVCENAKLTATPEQLFTGTELGLPTLEAICRSCKQTLHEGDSCAVYVYQPAADVQWYTRRCYCDDCVPETIRTPTLGTSEALVHAILGTIASQQTYRLCLTEIALCAFSPPTEGSEP